MDSPQVGIRAGTCGCSATGSDATTTARSTSTSSLTDPSAICGTTCCIWIDADSRRSLPPQSLLDVGSQGSPEGKPPFSELARLAGGAQASSANASGPIPAKPLALFIYMYVLRQGFSTAARASPCVCFTPSRSSWSASSSASYDALASASDEAGASIPTLGPDPRRGRAGRWCRRRAARRNEWSLIVQHRAHADRGGRQSRATQHCA